MSGGAVVWFTGLSGAGKSTIAAALRDALIREGVRSELLDGDEVREHLSRGLGFGKEDRDENVRRIAYVARLLARNGVVAIVSAISPYLEARALARRGVERFVEVHVDCPLDELRRRDPKGLYARALRGEIADFTGVSAPYEAPLQPELRLDTSRVGVQDCVGAVLAALGAERTAAGAGRLA